MIKSFEVVNNADNQIIIIKYNNNSMKKNKIRVQF